jgi:DNA-binding beta-propeller fold protein YncE
MKRQNNGISLFMAGLLMLSSSLLHAAQPKFSIVPLAGTVTSLLLPSNFTETVSYQATNQTAITRTLAMTPIQGVSQTTIGAGVCSNPFTLASQQSCTLTLVIDGNEVSTSGINGGPVICKIKESGNSSPDPFLCSQPSLQNTLAISVTTPGQHVYVANQTNNSISFCQVNPATGRLTHCAITVTGLGAPEGVGFNPAGTFFYIANLGNSSITVCQVNSATGALSGCTDSGGTGFSSPDAVAFSPDGSVFYTSNAGGGGSVSACLVNATTGLLSACVNNLSVTFSTPGDMAINSTGTLAYVVNRAASTTSVCNVSGQVVHSCNDLSGSFINGPEGITLSPLGLKAYIANAGNNKVIVCDVMQDSFGLLDNCSITNGAFRGTGNLGINNTGSIAYVPNQLTDNVFMCQIDRVTGELSNCSDSLGTGFVGPSGVVVR